MHQARRLALLITTLAVVVALGLAAPSAASAQQAKLRWHTVFTHAKVKVQMCLTQTSKGYWSHKRLDSRGSHLGKVTWTVFDDGWKRGSSSSTYAGRGHSQPMKDGYYSSLDGVVVKVRVTVKHGKAAKTSFALSTVKAC